MVKGVNKTVIEVNNTGSKIFDRIVFYVTAQYGNLSAKELMKATENFTFQFDKRSGRGYKKLRRRMIQKRLLRVALITAISAAVLIVAVLMFKKIL